MGQKIKVVLDTNVWLSIFMRKTLARDFSKIFKEKRAEIYISKQILEEISRVLLYPRISRLVEMAGVTAKEILERIVENSIVVDPKFKLDVIKEDSEDNKFLECAMQANVNFIVSGDRHLLKLRKYGNIRIVTSRELLEMIFA